MDEVLVSKKVAIAVTDGVVSIEIHCGGPYEARVVFEDLTGRLNLDGNVRVTIDGATRRQ